MQATDGTKPKGEMKMTPHDSNAHAAYDGIRLGDGVTFDMPKLIQRLLEADHENHYLTEEQRGALALLRNSAPCEGEEKRRFGEALESAYQNEQCARFLEAAVAKATSDWRPWEAHLVLRRGYTGKRRCQQCRSEMIMVDAGRVKCEACRLTYRLQE